MAEEKTEGTSSNSKISGHVYSKGRAILNGAKVRCDGFETSTLADGFYIFDKLPSGSYEVTVDLQGFRPESGKVSIGDNEAAIMDFYLSLAVGTGRIRGRVYDSESGKPIVSGGTVILILPISNRYTRIDMDGCYEFADLPPGTYGISTSIPECEDYEAVVTIVDGESKTHDFHCRIRRAVEPPWG